MTREPAPYGLDPDGPPVGVFSSPPPAYRPRWWLHGLLLVLTLLTTTFFGALFAGSLPEEMTNFSLARLILDPRFITEGLKFSIPLLIILLTHELGHYTACRRHGLLATPPFFIPAPLGIGTFGAVIRIKEPLRDKMQLLDIGAAGPLAGFVALIPFLIYGVAVSHVGPVPTNHNATVFIFGEPLAFKLVAHAFYPHLAQGTDIILSPTGFAAWFGLLLTALNMLPFAQLDGGHIAYALFGRWHRRVAWPLWTVLFALGFKWIGWWVWAVIALVLGVSHPRIWDENRPLDKKRKAIAWLTFLVFVLCFMPQPIKLVP